MGGFGEGLESFLKFTMWFIPIAGVLAIWKAVEIVIWLVNHVSVR